MPHVTLTRFGPSVLGRIFFGFSSVLNNFNRDGTFMNCIICTNIIHQITSLRLLIKFEPELLNHTGNTVVSNSWIRYSPQSIGHTWGLRGVELGQESDEKSPPPTVPFRSQSQFIFFLGGRWEAICFYFETPTLTHHLTEEEEEEDRSLSGGLWRRHRYL